jgi:glucan biosynthesis protein C
MNAIESAAPSPASMSEAAATAPLSLRRPRVAEVDWLRMLIVLAIIPYHALILFSAASATVLQNTTTNAQLPIIFGALEAWGIPLIFLLAGASSKFALDVRPPANYVKERILRLLVPVLLVMLVFAPLRAYYLLLSNPSLIGVSPTPIAHPEDLRNIGAFFQQYLTSLLTTGSPIVVRNSLAHLWFVPRLLIASIICLPLFLSVRARWPEWTRRLASSRIPMGALLLGGGLVPAILVALLQPGWLHRLTASLPLNEDWTSFTLEVVLFIYGYLIYSSVELRAAMRRLAPSLLLLAAACWAIVFVIRLGGHTPPNTFSLANALFSLTQVFAIWLLVAGVLGLGMRYLTRTTTWQTYLTTATFPVYILHLPLLTIIAYYLRALPVPWFVLLPLIAGLTLGASFALYEFVVRRVPFIRLLFGLNSRRAPVPESERQALPSTTSS